MAEKTRSILITGFYLTVGGLCVRGFFDASTFYSDFKLVLGLDLQAIPPQELVYASWFLFLGSLAAIAWSLGLQRTSVPAWLQTAFAWLLARRRAALVGLTMAVVLLAALFRRWVLLDAPVADDESTYVFIAKTLQHGRLLNPLPADQAVVANQFVVMNHLGWFGKYPIGHPLVLAAADYVGALSFVGPLLAGLSLLVTYAIGRRVFDERIALLGLLLLAISPHFLLTSATLLSQTTSTLAMLAGLYFTIRFMESSRSRFGALAGLLFAYGVMVRPLPGALFYLAALFVVLVQPDGLRLLQRLRARWAGLLLFLCFGVLVVVLLSLVNLAQTGSLFRTGYHEVHGAVLGVPPRGEGWRPMSVVAALFRQNLWLFGWPLSLLFVGFVRRNRWFPLLVAMVAAEYLYRVIAPKTVVSSTGPIYVTEIVPLLALASASGIVEAKRWLEGNGIARARPLIASLTVSLTVVGLLCFWPIQLTALGHGARQWQFPYRVLEAHGIGKALVFADRMVNPNRGVTWAYWPPNPSPTVADDILFVRVPRTSPDVYAAMREFHGRRYPDRPAFVLRVDGPTSELTPLPP